MPASAGPICFIGGKPAAEAALHHPADPADGRQAMAAPASRHMQQQRRTGMADSGSVLPGRMGASAPECSTSPSFTSCVAAGRGRGLAVLEQVQGSAPCPGPCCRLVPAMQQQGSSQQGARCAALACGARKYEYCLCSAAVGSTPLCFTCRRMGGSHRCRARVGRSSSANAATAACMLSCQCSAVASLPHGHGACAAPSCTHWYTH